MSWNIGSEIDVTRVIRLSHAIASLWTLESTKNVAVFGQTFTACIRAACMYSHVLHMYTVNHTRVDGSCMLCTCECIHMNNILLCTWHILCTCTCINNIVTFCVHVHIVYMYHILCTCTCIVTFCVHVHNYCHILCTCAPVVYMCTVGNTFL